MTKQKLRESLNKFDNTALNECTQYYDLLALFEAVNYDMTDEDQKALSELVRKKDGKGLHDYMVGMTDRDNKKISAKTLESFVEESTKDDEYIDIDDATLLDEGRRNLKPVKCRALVSHKTYWSPYDPKNGDFAKFGVRYRYDSREKCQDAINDYTNDLGYEADGSSHQKDKPIIRNGEEVVEEVYIGNKEVSDSDYEIYLRAYRQVELDLKHPVKKDGSPFQGAVLLIKLYELTDGGTKVDADDKIVYIPRKEWMIACGYSEKDSSHDAHCEGLIGPLTHQGLIKRGGANNFILTAEGLLYVEGDNPDHADLTKFVGEEAKKRRDHRHIITKSHPKAIDSSDDHYASDEDRELAGPDIFAGVTFDEPTKSGFEKEGEPKTKRSKSTETSTSPRAGKVFRKLIITDEELTEERKSEIKSAKDMYRYYANLDADTPITEEILDDFLYKHMCAMNGLPFEKTREDLLS